MPLLRNSHVAGKKETTMEKSMIKGIVIGGLAVVVLALTAVGATRR